jgi:preprotein translocase subunit SecD
MTPKEIKQAQTAAKLGYELLDKIDKCKDALRQLREYIKEQGSYHLCIQGHIRGGPQIYINLDPKEAARAIRSVHSRLHKELKALNLKNVKVEEDEDNAEDE